MKPLIIAILLCVIVLAGCHRGDFKAELVVKGQAAPFNGYNVGPELYVEEGDPVPVSGILFWVKNLDPNDILDGLEDL